MTMEICEDYTIEIDERFHRMKPWNANIIVEFKGQIKGKKRIERYVKDVIRCLYPNILLEPPAGPGVPILFLNAASKNIIGTPGRGFQY